MSRITVSVQLGTYPDPRDPTVEIKFDDQFISDAYQSLDLPSPDADAFSRMVCTRSDIIRMVTMSRAQLAKRLSGEIAAALIKTMEANDTEMGYAKERGVGVALSENYQLLLRSGRGAIP